MHTIVLVSPAGIPVVIPAHPHKQPLSPALRLTLGLPVSKDYVVTLSKQPETPQQPSTKGKHHTATIQLPHIKVNSRSPQSGREILKTAKTRQEDRECRFGGHSSFRGHRENAHNKKGFGCRLKLAAMAPNMQLDMVL